MNNAEEPRAFMWAVFHGQIHDEGYLVAVFDTKKEAEKAIREFGGYKFNKSQQKFITYNDRLLGDARWYRIDKTPRNSLF